jgi:uncharacterized membrane protein
MPAFKGATVKLCAIMRIIENVAIITKRIYSPKKEKIFLIILANITYMEYYSERHSSERQNIQCRISHAIP